MRHTQEEVCGYMQILQSFIEGLWGTLGCPKKVLGTRRLLCLYIWSYWRLSCRHGAFLLPGTAACVSCEQGHSFYVTTVYLANAGC